MLRHSLATTLIHSAVSADVVAAQLGHSSIDVTLKYYTHTNISDVQKQLDERLII